MVSRQLVYVTGVLEVILGLSDPSEGSKQVAELSDASEIVKTGGGSFPRPRKRSAARFDTFRGVGRRSNKWRKSASTCAPLPPLGICPIFTPT